MRFRTLCLCVLCLVLVLTATACRSTPDEDTQSTTTTAPTTPTTAVIIEKDLGDMLTAQEISDAVGVSMGDPVVSGQGTILTSIGTESKTVLNVEVSERPIAVFYDMLKGYPDIQACPNLGESAWFSPIHNQLLVYGNGFMILIELTGTDDGDQNIQRLRCRQIAALLLEHL